MILVQKNWIIGRRVIGISLANELWYETRDNGDLVAHMFRFGYTLRGDLKLWSLHILGLVIRFG